MTQLYTNSRLKVLRNCIARHHYQYILGIRTPSNYAMTFGTATHAALEAYLLAWKRGNLDGRLAAAMAAVDSSQLNAFDREKLRALVVAYHLRWGGEDWEILEVEIEFRYDLDGNIIGGKIDGLIRDRRDGRVWLLEHKTSTADTSPGSVYWERLTLDSQVSIYIDGATMLGYEIAGCIYDVLKRPEHEQLMATPTEKRKYTVGKGCKKCGGSAKPGAIEKGNGYYTVSLVTVENIVCDDCNGTGWKRDKDGIPEAPRLHSNQRDRDETLDEFADRISTVIGEDPDNFLQRAVIVRLDDDLPKMRADLLDAIKLERVTSAVGLLVKNTDACARYGSMCPFFGPCSGRADINDETLFPRERAHPELAAA